MPKPKTEKISTGSYDLNKWLYGGWEKDVITMLVGPAGSGKTNFAILAACSVTATGRPQEVASLQGTTGPSQGP